MANPTDSAPSPVIQLNNTLNSTSPSRPSPQTNLTNGSGRSTLNMSIGAKVNATDDVLCNNQGEDTASLATPSSTIVGDIGTISPPKITGATTSAQHLAVPPVHATVNVAPETDRIVGTNENVDKGVVQQPGASQAMAEIGPTMIITPRKVHGQFPSRNNKPRKPRGHRAIEQSVADPTKSFDRESAKFRVPEQSKLEMDFMTERKVPGTDNWIPSNERIYNRYAHTVDFNNRGHITKLNQWRHQIISRNFAPISKMRAYWLNSEKEQIVASIRAELARGSTIHWNKITNAFNDRNHGTIHPAGSELLNPGKGPATTGSNREAPWRSRASIEHAAYKWDEYRELLGEKRAQWGNDSQAGEDVEADSGDEEENPDPQPGPLTLEESQNRRKNYAKTGREKKKATKGSEAKQDEPKQTNNQKRNVGDFLDDGSTDDEFGPVDDRLEAPPRPAKKRKTGASAPALEYSSALPESAVQGGSGMTTTSPTSGVSPEQTAHQKAVVDVPGFPEATGHDSRQSSDSLNKIKSPKETVAFKKETSVQPPTSED